MQYRSYRLIGESKLSRLELPVREVVDQWAHAWWPASISVEVRVVRPDQYEGGTVLAGTQSLIVAGERACGWCTVYCSQSLRKDLTLRLVGAHAGMPEPAADSALVSEIFGACIVDLVLQVGAAVAGVAWPASAVTATPDDESRAWEKGSGALLVECAFAAASETLCLVFSGHVLGAAMAGNPQSPLREILTARKAAIGNQSMTLHVNAGHVELEVGLMQTITKGDVIKFPSSSNEPLLITSETGELICKAYLGVKDDHKAIQVTG